ncbi:DUF2971 domain-containing protein [Aeromonas caviae]|uniref:DUF2971 domain-containing protein n=1 Tax=Aeromonas caviae TaxID=648 RepID=UPI002B49340E|nr:DUF2971 domain-containing protein [Aeromonas caviae]
MNTLYKYYSPRLDIIKYLENPTIKLSSTKSFNDPFEMSMANTLAEKLSKTFIKLISPKEEHNEYDQNEYTHEFKEISKNYGFVSLTETHRNILMWAHYAGSHEGFCIGYKNDFLSSKYDKSIESKNDEVNLLPLRVKYDKKRFDPAVYRQKMTYTQLITQAMTTKSDEWIYEKEHRCIVPIRIADKFMITDTSNKETVDSVERLIKGSSIEITNEKNTYKFKRGFPSWLPIGQSAFEVAFELNDSVLLKEIDINSVQSVYFGCKASPDIIEKTINLINKNPEKYNHISIYKYTTNKDEFDLDLKCILNEPSEFNIDDDLFNSFFL